MDNSFITWSGWICTVISTIIAILQYVKKEDYKKQIISLKQSTGNSETYNAENKGIAMRENRGPINIK